MTTLDLIHEIDNSMNIECYSIPSPEECGKIISKHEVTLLHVNIRSMQKNFEFFSVMLARLKISFDVIVLSECWINDSSIIKQIDGYTSYNTKKYINKSGGVIIYVNTKWSANVTEPDIDEANGLVVEVPKAFTVIGIYRSPSFTNPAAFINSLETYLKNHTSTSSLILTVDININILDSSTDENTSNYLNLMAEHGMISAINAPTHDKSCIDHIFVRSKSLTNSIICKTDLTDHAMVMAGINTQSEKCPPLKRSRLKIDFEGLKKAIEQTDWSNVTNNESLNDAVLIFSNTLSELVNIHSKVVQISHSKFNINPWMTSGLIRCSKHKDKLHSQSRKYPNDATKKLIYTRYRNYYIALLRNLKAEYDNKELKKYKNVPKKLWKSINHITHRHSKNNKTAHELTKIKDTTEDSLDECNKYFSSVGQVLANSILTQSNETQESLANNVKIKETPLNSLFISPTDEEEIKSLIMQLDPDSSPGLDNINNRMLKATCNVIAKPLEAIFNLSIRTGVFPQAWKSAAVVPIHKCGSKDLPNNFRPISLLGSISKLLERIVNKRLVSFLESNSLLMDRQFGFRQGRSTEDAVTLLTDIISAHLDNGRNCIGVFLDLAKAFDTVSIPILLKKLEAYGVRGSGLEWFTSYLTNRNQSVKIGDHVSSLRSIAFGVPQGSILGPTLFLLYINDIDTLPLQNADILCYADDTAVIFHGCSWPVVTEKAQDGMSQVLNWLNSNLLTLNTSKTKFMCFHKTAASNSHEITHIKIHSRQCLSSTDLTCKCGSIERVESLKYLGVIIDERLTFKEHMISMSKRVRKLLYVFKNLRDIDDGKIIKLVYYSLCQSIINYCILAWGCAAASTLIILERAQRGVLKVALKKPIRFPTTTLYEEAQVLSVRKLFYMRVAVSVHKKTINSDNYHEMLRKRVFKLPIPSVKSSFAQRFRLYTFPFIYNKLVYLFNFKHCSTFETKLIITNHLISWTYDESESLLKQLK